MSLTSKIYSVASVRAIDRAAIASGIAGYALMRRAGQAAVDYIEARFPDAQRWQVICGAGNNAGDGYVVARVAAEKGIAVSIIALVDPENLTGDAATAWMDFEAEGGACTLFNGALDEEADLLVDGLLGSGLDRPVEGSFADAIVAMNEHAAPVLALDIPSGIDGDSGRVMGAAVEASATVTFVGLKGGLFLGDGARHAGTLYLAGLDIPPECRQEQPALMQRIRSSILVDYLPPRAHDAHKGDFGHVVVIGGGPGMPGAALLAGEAALRCGAGRVSVATHPAHAAQIAARCPELMCHGVESVDALSDLLRSATIVAIGPGLGQDDWARSMLECGLASGLPAVIDADALNLLADGGAESRDWILTPHPGEAARLLASTAPEVQADRLGTAAEIQARYGGVVVLKGAGSLVSAGGTPWLCGTGNPGMAAPGMGDLLTGVIAALRAQGLDAERAACAGVYLHGRAGDVAARAGERGMQASDLLPELRNLANP